MKLRDTHCLNINMKLKVFIKTTDKERYTDLIQTLVIDRPNLRMNNREKIIGGDSLWRPTEAAKSPIFEGF